jgi:hypothetical protein
MLLDARKTPDACMSRGKTIVTFPIIKLIEIIRPITLPPPHFVNAKNKRQEQTSMRKR